MPSKPGPGIFWYIGENFFSLFLILIVLSPFIALYQILEVNRYLFPSYYWNSKVDKAQRFEDIQWKLLSWETKSVNEARELLANNPDAAGLYLSPDGPTIGDSADTSGIKWIGSEIRKAREEKKIVCLELWKIGGNNPKCNDLLPAKKSTSPAAIAPLPPKAREKHK